MASVRDRQESGRMSQRRAARLHAREEQRRRAMQQRNTRIALMVGAALIVAGGIAAFVIGRVQAQPGKAVQLMAGAQTHIGKTDPLPKYNSKPPTSGPHWNLPGEAPVGWGIYKEPIPDQVQIHNLEHGGINIQYNCSDCPELVQQLEEFYDRWWPANKLPLFPNSSKLIVAPYPDMPSHIALTAWGRIDTMDAYDEDRIIRFIEAWRGKAPEQVP